MNAVRRGIRNAFRNSMRTVGVVVILAVAIALSISMLIARDAVTNKINTVKASTGTTVSVSPKGFFGFNGGGTPLSMTTIDALLNLPNVTAVQESFSEELSSSKTSLTSPTPAGQLGSQFGNGGGFGASGRTAAAPRNSRRGLRSRRPQRQTSPSLAARSQPRTT